MPAAVVVIVMMVVVAHRRHLGMAAGATCTPPAMGAADALVVARPSNPPRAAAVKSSLRIAKILLFRRVQYDR